MKAWRHMCVAASEGLSSPIALLNLWCSTYCYIGGTSSVRHRICNLQSVRRVESLGLHVWRPLHGLRQTSRVGGMELFQRSKVSTLLLLLLLLGLSPSSGVIGMVMNISLPLCSVRPPLTQHLSCLVYTSLSSCFSLFSSCLFVGAGSSNILLSMCHSSLLLTFKFHYSLMPNIVYYSIPQCFVQNRDTNHGISWKAPKATLLVWCYINAYFIITIIVVDRVSTVSERSIQSSEAYVLFYELADASSRL